MRLKQRLPLIMSLVFFMGLSISFAQDQSNQNDNSKAGIYAGFAKNNFNKNENYLNLGIDLFGSKDNNNEFLKPLFNFDGLFGFGVSKSTYAISFSPGLRLDYGLKSNFKFHYDISSGISFIRNPFNISPEVGLNAKLGLGIGYQNFLLYLDVKYLQCRNFSIAPISIGVKFQIP